MGLKFDPFENRIKQVGVTEQELAAELQQQRGEIQASLGQELQASIATVLENVRDATQLSVGFFADVSAGLASTSSEEYFTVVGDDDLTSGLLYLNSSGSAVLISEYPSVKGVERSKWAGKTNGWPDPFFRSFDFSTATNFFDRNRWWGDELSAWSLVDNKEFDGKALRRAANLDLTPFNGPYLYFDELDVEAGDAFTIRLLVSGDGVGVRLYARTSNGPGSFVGPQLATPYVTAQVGNPGLITLQLTADTGATGVSLYFADNDPAKSYDIVALWAYKGVSSSGPSWPTLSDPGYVVGNLVSRVGTLEPTVASLNEWKTYATPIVTASVAASETVNASITSKTIVEADSTQVVIDGTGFSAFPQALPFTGWGARFTTPLTTAFNVIRVVSVSRPSATPEEAQWRTLYVVVRAGATNTHAAGATVVAVGRAYVNSASNSLQDVDFILRDPATDAPKTLTPAELNAEYFVGLYARTYDENGAACGEPKGTNPNWIGQSYYITSQNPLTGSWVDYTQDGPIGFRFLLSTSPSVTLDGTSFSATVRGLPFTGWGARYTPVSGVSFNAIRIVSITRSTTTDPAAQARTLNVVVRKGAIDTHVAGSTVVAVGTVYVDPAQESHTNLDILLKDPSTGAPKTLSASDLGSEYFIGVYARNASGGGAACGEPKGTNPNWIGQSYYITGQNPLTGSWVDYTQDGPIGFQHVLIESPSQTLKPIFLGQLLSPLIENAADISYSNQQSGLASTDVQGAVDELAASVDALETATPDAPELILPPQIYGLEGQEVSVYFDNLVPDDIGQYLVDVSTSSGNVGRQQNERWQWVSSGALSGGTLTIGLHDKKTGSLLKSATAARHSASASSGGGLTPKVMVIGDSLINAGIITQTLLDNSGSDVMGVALYGTRGTAPNLHEGRGGWTINSYTSAVHADGTANPFWDGSSANFPWYLQQNSYPSMDWVIIQLGINDCFSQTSDAGALSVAQAAFVKLDGLIASIKSSGASTKVGLMIPSPPSSDQDSFGANYTTSQVRWRFKRNILIWARELIAKYQGQESNRIYIIPSNTALDTVNNMARAGAAPVNSRSSVTVQRQANGVHPAAEGYRQLGDAVWAFLKYQA